MKIQFFDDNVDSEVTACLAEAIAREQDSLAEHIYRPFSILDHEQAQAFQPPAREPLTNPNNQIQVTLTIPAYAEPLFRLLAGYYRAMRHK